MRLCTVLTNSHTITKNCMIPVYRLCTVLASGHTISTGNRMGESVIGKTLYGNRKITRGKAVWYLNCCKCKFFQNCTLIHVIMITYYSRLTFTKLKRSLPYIFKSWPHAISSEPVQFQVNPCNFKWTRAISSEPVQFQVNPCNFKWTRAISSEPVQFQVNTYNFKWTRAISSEPVQSAQSPCTGFYCSQK